jgi:hypothetical protein
MRHVRGFRGTDEIFPIRANAHPLRLDTDWNLCDHLPAVDVEEGDEIAVLVRNIEQLASGIEREELRVWAAWQGSDDLVDGEVEHFDVVAVAGADVQRLRVFRE